MSEDPRTPETAQDAITAYWDQRAAEYDRLQRERQLAERDRTLWSDRLASVLPPAPARILDLGTGSGFLAFVLAELGYDVTGTDLSQTMVDIARERNRERRAQSTRSTPAGGTASFAVGDAVEPDFAPSSFDVITSRYLLWTLRDPERALQNWHRLLRPGGVIACADALWFPDGIAANPTPSFTEHYDAEVRARLPLAESDTIQLAADTLAHAGFADVTILPLDEVYALDASRDSAPGHEPRLQSLVTARIPEHSVSPNERPQQPRQR